VATMNKPGANDDNWYQPVTDNWTSIETKLIDKSTYAAKGDLLVATGPASPARLPAGSNGQVIYADSTQPPGVRWDDPMDMANFLLLKSFFKAQSLMPSTVIKEALYTWPAADFANLNGGSLSLSMSRVKVSPSTNPANFGWNLGATYSKVLVIVGGLRPMAYDAGIIIGNTVPTAPNLPDGYLLQNETPPTSEMAIYKANGGGSYTKLASDSTVYSAGIYSSPTCGLAAYVDGTAHRLCLWSRMGSETWMLIHDITDSTLSTFKYAGITIATESGSVMWLTCPLGIYAQ